MKNIIKNDKGVTVIALIITIILTLIIAAIVVKYGTDEIDKAKLEDIKTTMLLIKGKAQIIIEKEDFGDDYDAEGMLSYEDATSYTPNIPSDLADILEDAGTENLYIWETTAMQNSGIDVTVTTEDFYIIDYNTKEVYSSLGFEVGDNTYYSLTELQGLED